MPTSRAPLLHQLKRQILHLRRRAYNLRAFVPGMREHHRFELMVGPLGFWHALQRYQLQLLQTNGLKPHHTLLDIGCGPLQGGIAFIKYLEPNGYAGIDIGQDRIAAAQTQIAKHRLADKNPRVLVSSTFGRDELGSDTFDFFWASQILYYFNDEAMHQLLETIRQRMRPGGKFLGDIFALDHYEFRFPEHPGRYVRHTKESLEVLAEKHSLKVRELGTIEQFGYPKRLSLRTNPLFEFTAKNE
jgi:SAM-dependent methyltransferase